MVSKTFVLLTALVKAVVLPRDGGELCNFDGSDPDAIWCGVGTNARCTSIMSDTLSCGKCGAHCATGQYCIKGVCQEYPCKANEAKDTYCFKAGGCVDLQTDSNHCGACGIRCHGPDGCQNGRCDRIPPPIMSSSSASPDTLPPSSAAPSGNEPSTVAASSASPSRPAPTSSAATPSPSKPPRGTPCGPNGQQYCNGICTEVMTDPLNCGECTHVCVRGQSCQNGKCIKEECQPGWEHCPFEEGCVDLQASANNCGRCGVRCLTGMICTGGQCDYPDGSDGISVGPPPKPTPAPTPTPTPTPTPVPSASPTDKPPTPSGPPPTAPSLPCNYDKPGFFYCAVGTDLECFNTMNDNRHCGACGTACRPGENCENGVCSPPGGCGAQTYCPTGLHGLCVNLENDNRNCGACNVECGVGQNCVGGRCTDGA